MAYRTDFMSIIAHAVWKNRGTKPWDEVIGIANFKTLCNKTYCLNIFSDASHWHPPKIIQGTLSPSPPPHPPPHLPTYIPTSPPTSPHPHPPRFPSPPTSPPFPTPTAGTSFCRSIVPGLIPSCPSPLSRVQPPPGGHPWMCHAHLGTLGESTHTGSLYVHFSTCIFKKIFYAVKISNNFIPNTKSSVDTITLNFHF